MAHWRATLKKAFGRLAAERLVTREAGHQWRFAPSLEGEAGVRASYEVRLLLEPGALLLKGAAIEQHTVQEQYRRHEQLVTAVSKGSRWRKIPTPSTVVELDADFHEKHRWLFRQFVHRRRRSPAECVAPVVGVRQLSRHGACRSMDGRASRDPRRTCRIETEARITAPARSSRTRGLCRGQQVSVAAGPVFAKAAARQTSSRLTEWIGRSNVRLLIKKAMEDTRQNGCWLHASSEGGVGYGWANRWIARHRLGGGRHGFDVSAGCSGGFQLQAA